MNAVSLVMACFSMLGALDRIFGDRLGLGKEFEKGLLLFGNLALSMIGMIVLSPVIAQMLQPVFRFISGTLHIDPSILPASLFANDLGGAALCAAVMVDEQVGLFNALVVSSMMGALISFTIPYALGAVQKRQHPVLLLGMLCGVVTLPLGCFIAGLMLRIPLGALLADLLPLILFSALITLGLLRCPGLCVRIFSIFGVLLKVLITIGLALSILRYLTGAALLPGMGTLEEATGVCLNACAVMTGAFPLLAILSRLASRPLKKLGAHIGVNETSITGLVSTLASSMTTYEMMKDMDSKGVLLNSAFSVCAAFVFADHLAFTIAFRAEYLPAVIVGKLSAGLLALLVAGLMSSRLLSRVSLSTCAPE